ncbi:MAG: hypothetical protein P8Z35_06860 [Ignavibacteriaceae bacterium]
MKKLLFIVLIFISVLKIEKASNIPLYSHEHPAKSNIECIYNPAQNNINTYFSLNSPKKEFVKNSNSNKIFLQVNRLSVLYFNKYVNQQFKITEYNFKSLQLFIKIPPQIIHQNSCDEDPLRLG